MWVICWILLLCLGCGLEFKPLTMSKLKQIRGMVDNVYYFVLVNGEVKDQMMAVLEAHPILSTQPNIRYLTTDCSEKLLKACDSPQNIPVVLFYNKGGLSFSKYGAVKQFVDTIKWMEVVFLTHPHALNSISSIETLLQAKGEIFLLLKGDKGSDEKIGYELLSKQFPYIDFVYLTDGQVGTNLALTPGNITYYKGELTQDNREVSTLPLRLDAWKHFVGGKFMHNVPSIDKQFLGRRFPLQPYQAIILIWDSSPNSYQIYDELRSWEMAEIQDQLGVENGTQVMKVVVRDDQIKVVDILEVYYHMKLKNQVEMPVAVYVDNGNSSSKMPERYIQPLSMDDKILPQLKSFIQAVRSKSVEGVVLDSGVVKKNGFYGKGSEKLIQKLSYSTYHTALHSALTSNKYYLLLVTAFQFECPKCTQFYTQYKKCASYISTEYNNLIFGVYDLSKDQIDEPLLQNIPDILLYTPQRETIRNKRRYTFEGLLSFIEENVKRQNDEL